MTSLEINYSDLELGKELGKGGFGVVYKGVYRHIPVAIKQLHNASLNEGALEEFKSETTTMVNLRHPNIVQLYGICLAPYCMVMEFMGKGSLFNLLHNKAVELPWSLRLSIANDIALGLLFLHGKNIVHRDLKSMNVLLDENNKAKLADFGLSRVKNERSSTTKNQSVGTLMWMAPELFGRGARYTDKCDIYSLAMVYWEIAERKIPFAEEMENPSQIAVWVTQGEREKISDDCPQAFAKLITDCWQGKGDQRPNMEAILKQIKGISSASTIPLQTYQGPLASLKPVSSTNRPAFSNTTAINSPQTSSSPHSANIKNVNQKPNLPSGLSKRMDSLNLNLSKPPLPQQTILHSSPISSSSKTIAKPATTTSPSSSFNSSPVQSGFFSGNSTAKPLPVPPKQLPKAPTTKIPNSYSLGINRK
jgi:serine/threonine protein kinase